MAHPSLPISSPHNSRVKQIIDLRERRQRDKSGLFVIEGYRELLRACNGRQQIEALFYCPEFFLGSNEGSLINKIVAAGAELFQFTEKIFSKISYRDRPDGLLAIARQQPLGLSTLQDRLICKHPPLLVVAEAIEKPGNLGTILRSSDAVGADGVLVCDRCTDIYNPNVIRASVGTLFTVPVVETSSQEAIQWLKQQGIAIVAATPQATEEYTDVALTAPVAIAVGTEQLGLSQQWMSAADLQVRIPMLGAADSLNVAMATTLLLYEALRQRKQEHKDDGKDSLP